MDKVVFTRSELHTLVWKFPLIQIAKHYEISTMGIKNACDKLQISMPNNRHWYKPEFKRTKAPELSSDYTGNDQTHILKKTYEMQLRQTPKSTPLLDLVQKIKKDLNRHLVVGEKLENPVPIISITKDYLANYNLGQIDQANKLKILNLNISDKNTQRALLFMDQFIKLLEQRGHQFSKNKNGHDIIVFKTGIEIDVTLREARKRITIDGRRETSQYIFTGELILRVKRKSISKEWRDGKIMLEMKLAVILAKIEQIAEEEFFL